MSRTVRRWRRSGAASPRSRRSVTSIGVALRNNVLERVEDGFEEVGVDGAQPGEGLVGVADEGAQDPGHLSADEAEYGDPDLEERAGVGRHRAVGGGFKRAGGWFRGFVADERRGSFDRGGSGASNNEAMKGLQEEGHPEHPGGGEDEYVEEDHEGVAGGGDGEERDDRADGGEGGEHDGE